MILTDTLYKLIEVEKNVYTLPIELIGKDTLINENSVEGHNVHYHLSSLENVVKQKNKEIKKLRYI